MCDVVYTIALDRLREDWLAQYQAGATVPDWMTWQAEFDALLAEPLAAVDPDRVHLLRALGLWR